MRHRFLALAAALLAGPLMAGEKPADFAARFPIEVPPGAALVRITLPQSVYAALAGPELADLRVFNGAGKALPVARLPVPPEIAVTTAQVPLLPLPEATAPGTEARLRVSRAADGTLLRIELDQPGAPPPARPSRYVADLQPLRQPVTTLVVKPADATAFEGGLRLESSDDLATWTLVRSSERILSLGEGERRMERLRIELPGLRARYLRISWTTIPVPMALAGLVLEHAAATETPRQWVTLTPEPDGTPGVWRYAAPGLFPIDRLRVDAAEPNTVAHVRAESRSASAKPWESRGSFTIYRLNQEGGEITSPPHSLTLLRDPLWQLSLQPPTGDAPTLALGWLPETLVFAARGSPPFTLAVGQPRLPASFLPIETLVPGYAMDLAPPLADGHVQPPASGSAAPPRRDAPAWQDGRSLVLWAMLVLGVAVLGWMAVRLLREKKR